MSFVIHAAYRLQKALRIINPVQVVFQQEEDSESESEVVIFDVSDDESDSEDEEETPQRARASRRKTKRTFRHDHSREDDVTSSTFGTAVSLLQAPLWGAPPRPDAHLTCVWPAHAVDEEDRNSGFDIDEEQLRSDLARKLRVMGDDKWGKGEKKKIKIERNVLFKTAVEKAIYKPHGFQLKAFSSVERGDCTLVLASTGSGKTDVSLCAIYQVHIRDLYKFTNVTNVTTVTLYGQCY
jgi:superfamily II RNA helicase